MNKNYTIDDFSSECNIVRLTNALYNENVKFSYENLRDSLSLGQLYSKKWCMRVLNDLFLKSYFKNYHFHHLGSWHGLLSALIAEKYKLETCLIDPDIDAIVLSHYVHNELPHLTFNETSEYYTESTKFGKDHFVLNTSCEHMSNVWIRNIQSQTLICAQSTNYKLGEGHINIMNSIDEFKNDLNLSEIYYANELKFDMYSRYMIIGRK